MNVSVDRMILKMMECMVIVVRKDVDVRVKNEVVRVLDGGSGRVRVNDIRGLVVE